MNDRNSPGALPGLRVSLPVGFSVLLLASVLIMGFSGAVWSQHDTETQIMGKVVSSETGEALPFSNIVVKSVSSPGDTVGTAAGGTFAMQDGMYRVSVEPGLYMILASHVGYHPKRVTGIWVESGQSVSANVTLVPAAIQIETVQVRSYKDETSEAAVLQHQKKAAAVSDGVSAEQISRSSDSDAAEVLQRVTGLSVVGGRYVFVRGLGERYSSTQVDGSTVGTPEANKRVVPLDLFAAGLLDNIVVQKTYTPDMPGDFGGGVVNVNMRDFPGQRTWGVSISSGYDNTTTGEGFLTYDGGGYDFLGIDDGTRSLPDLVDELASNTIIRDRGVFSSDTLELLGESFENTWERKSKKAPVPYSFKASYGDEVSLFGQPLGLLGSLSFSHGFKTTEGKEASYSLDVGELDAQRDYDATTSTASTLWGLITNTSYRLNSHNTLSFRAMYNRSAEDETRRLHGPNLDTTGDDWLNVRYRYIERGLFTSSVGSSHNVAPLGGITVDTKFTYSRATRDEPDRREYNYEIKRKFITDDDGNVIDEYDVWRLSTKDNSLRPTRQFGSMEEDHRKPQIDVTIPFRQWNKLDSKLKVGASHENKDRDFSWRRFYFKEPSGVSPAMSDSIFALPPEILLSPEWVGGTSRFFRLNENTFPQSDNYRGHLDITAGYGMIDIPLHRKLRLVTGVRLEEAKVRVEAYDPYGQTDVEALASGELDDTDWLPSANLTYALSEKSNIRLAASKTINRPEFRELSIFSVLDIEGGYTEQGNPDLKRSQIYNYDLRFETYPAINELLAFSVFYKHLKDPIETVLITASGGQSRLQPNNAHKGTLYGAEVEARYGLDRFGDRLQSFAVSGNLTLVESETDLGDLEVTQGTTKPPLHGQSPYVVNLGLFYAHPSGRTSASLIYNVFGERLDAVGIREMPDIYERPRHMLDMTLQHQLGGYSLKLALENLLAEDTRFAHEYQEDLKTTRLKEEGRRVSLSISFGG
ncbi:MAG: outer membrane beta-barrel protein [Candidatus Eisenbacteria bacterium]|nr:outer membrane beta-barrel protein [Candidatus Eisenbacteria bacterium]